MWVDEKGVYHTISLPEPEYLMSPGFQESLHRLTAADRVNVLNMLEEEKTRFLEREPAHPAGDDEDEFIEAIPPDGLLAERFDTTSELRALLQRIDERWRLDALFVLDEYVD